MLVHAQQPDGNARVQRVYAIWMALTIRKSIRTNDFRVYRLVCRELENIEYLRMKTYFTYFNDAGERLERREGYETIFTRTFNAKIRELAAKLKASSFTCK